MKVVGHNVNTQCRNWKEQGCTVASNAIGVPECMRGIFPHPRFSAHFCVELQLQLDGF